MGVPASLKLFNYCVDEIAGNIKVKLRVKLSDAGGTGNVYFRQVVAYDIYSYKH